MTQAEFDGLLKSGDRLEKIIVAYNDGRIDQLCDRDFKYFAVLRTAFKICCKDPIYIRAKRKIGEVLGAQRNRVNIVMKDVKEVFVNVEETNLEFDRMMMVHRLQRLIAKLEKVDIDSNNLPHYYKLLAEIQGVKGKKDDGINLKDLVLPLPVFTTNISDIPRFGESVEFEDVTNEK